MVFDDIVIGSGLSALGAVIGLNERRRVLVIGGPADGTTAYYDDSHTVPCAHLGAGGLGNFWHGVIPMGAQELEKGPSRAEFMSLFARFYPHSDSSSRYGESWLFVPWRAIRPSREWQRLLAERGPMLNFAREMAVQFDSSDGHVSVKTARDCYRSRRLWVCAGAIHSPDLLDRSLPQRVSRVTISDHVLCYLGQIDRRGDHTSSIPRVQRGRSGLWIEASYQPDAGALLTQRPARFQYRRLDFGIGQRLVFGMPTGNAISRILRRMSPGLLAEAFYNRFGLFPDAPIQSVYAQIPVADAYNRQAGDRPLTVLKDAILARIESVRRMVRCPGLVPTRRPDLFLPGIHLHNSIDRRALASFGIGGSHGPVEILDASICEDIGIEHHSFKLMAVAAARTRLLTS